MSTRSDVFITIRKDDWVEFAKNHKDNPFVKDVEIKSYETTDIVNVYWESVKWWSFTDTYVKEIEDYIKEVSCLVSILDDDRAFSQTDYIKNDEELSEFWNYSPQLMLNVDF